MSTTLWAVITLASAALGAGVGYHIRKLLAVKKRDQVETMVETLLSEAKTKQKEILLEANDKALQVIESAKQESKERQQELARAQKRLEQRESLFDQKLLDLENKQQTLEQKHAEAEKIRSEVEKVKQEQIAKLSQVAALSQDEARQILLTQVEEGMKEDLVGRMKKLAMISHEELERKSKEMLSLVIQRCASSHATETTTTTIDLPNDEMKGRIIGREGRNIRTIEKLTGAEIIIDDTPQALTISGFSLIRRHMAKRALEKLMQDGRIHPGRIEEAVEEAKKELAIDIKKAGEDALYELGITGLDPKLVSIIGRLKYRTSYGQNILHHSVEVAHLSTLLAQELGADVNIAKRGGLLHDIGKAVDHEIGGTHTQIGYDILKKYGLPEDICYICIGHHEDQPRTLESIIVKVADAISGARPGARKDSYEQYLQRLGDLEKVATAFPGIEKAYAIQAGREIRIFVVPQQIDDLAAVKLAKDVAKKVEEELTYPGEIKITVIRETRIVEYAR